MKASEAREMSVADLRDRIEIEKNNLDTSLLKKKNRTKSELSYGKKSS